MRTIAFLNQKGGVGKTTTVLNIGAALSKLNKKVLLVDIDPQANLTYSLGIQGHELRYTIYELLSGHTRYTDVIISLDHGYSIIPSNLNLSGSEIEFSGTAGREFLLKDALGDLRGFDYVLVDCPPSLGILSLNALTYVKEVIIPVQTEFLALQGMSQLFDTIDLVKKRINKNLKTSGIIATMFDKRKNLNREALDMIVKHFRKKVFKTVIRDNVSLGEAPSHGKNIFAYKLNSHGAEDYLSLTKEIIRKG